MSRKQAEQSYRSWTGERAETKRDRSGQKTVYQIVERGGQSFWTKVGMAFTNRDDSITVLLDAIPLSGKLQLREKSPPRGGARKERDM